MQLAVANSKHSPRLAPGGASAVGAVVGAAGWQAGVPRPERADSGRSLVSQIASLAFQGNPREQIYENQVPNKSPDKRQLWAAEFEPGHYSELFHFFGPLAPGLIK